VQKVEIIGAKEPRRRWSDEEKCRLVAEAFAPGAVTSHVARRRGVATSCLFAWRKRFADSPTGPASDAPRMIPVVVEATSRPATPVSCDGTPAALASRHAVITWRDGLRLEVPADYPTTALKALIAALRSAR